MRLRSGCCVVLQGGTQPADAWCGSCFLSPPSCSALETLSLLLHASMNPFATRLPAFAMASQLTHILHFLALLLATACAQSQTFFPGSVPLAAKSTYLNAYVGISNQSNFARTWPVFSSNPVRGIGLQSIYCLDWMRVATSCGMGGTSAHRWLEQHLRLAGDGWHKPSYGSGTHRHPNAYDLANARGNGRPQHHLFVAYRGA